MSHLENRVEMLEHTINGNGKQGMKTDVAILQREVSDISNDIKPRVARMEKGFWMAQGAFGIINLLIALLK